MAIASTTVWEMRATATAGNVNGGGFNPGNVAAGTDKTLADASSYTFADLASTNGTNASPQVTSAGHVFDSTDVGNIMHINSGTSWTAGFFEIVSVSGGAATLDRACGSSATLSSGTYHVGGALSLQHSTDQATFQAAVGGNKTWIKFGAYPLTGTLNIGSTPVGTTVLHLVYEGYNATRGDSPRGSTRPSITGGTIILAGNQTFKNIIISASVAGSMFQTGGRTHCEYCKFVNSTTTAGQAAVLAANYNTFLHCEFISYRGRGLSSGTISVANCVFRDSDIGLIGTSGANNYPNSIVNCIFANNVTSGLKMNSNSDTPLVILNCTFYGAENKLGVGIDFVTGNSNARIWGNLFAGFTTGVTIPDTSASSVGTTFLLNYNNFYNCTTNRNNFLAGSEDIALNPSFASVTQVTGTNGTTSGSVLTSAGADFSNVVDNQDCVYIASGTGITAGHYLITAHTSTTLTLHAAPGTSAVADKVFQITLGHNFSPGTNVRGVGPLGAFPGGLTTGYQDIGAVQRKEKISTDPGQANVRLATGYMIDDVSKTGTAAIPAASNVRSGTAVDATVGSAAIPSAANVRAGISVDATTGLASIPSAANVRAGTAVDQTVGTAAIPAASNVRSGTAVDATVGSAAIPAASNVRSGTAVDAGVGTCSVPAAADTRFGTAVDAGTGLLNLPAEADVKDAVTYDNATKVGSYAPVCDYPDEEDVREAVVFDTGAKTGSLDLPIPGNVREGTTYDGGVDGTLVPVTEATSVTAPDDEATIEGN